MPYLGFFFNLPGITNMTVLEAILLIEEESSDPDIEQLIEAWQLLIDTDIVWRLQGWYGRQAIRLIEDGTCREKQKIDMDRYRGGTGGNEF